MSAPPYPESNMSPKGNKFQHRQVRLISKEPTTHQAAWLRWCVSSGLPRCFPETAREALNRLILRATLGGCSSGLCQDSKQVFLRGVGHELHRSCFAAA